MSTSKELMLKTLNFESPERIPRQLWLLPWGQIHHPEKLKKIQQDWPDDIIHCPAEFAQQPRSEGDAFAIGHYIDEWGCDFINTHGGIIGEVKEPMVQTWDDLGKVRPPVEMLTFDVDKCNEFCHDPKNSDKFIIAGCCPRPYERLQFLRGTQNVMMDIALEEPKIFELMKIIHEYNLKLFEKWAKTDVDGMMFMDDWGSQQALLMRPDNWRKIYKPMYKEYIDIAHSAGKKTFMHSDGHIIEIMEDLIEIGLDAVNSQLFCMDIEEMGKRFAGKITFWGEIDRQHILPRGTLHEVEDAVKLVHKNLCKNGGVIAQCEFSAGGNPDNIYKVFETWNTLSA